MVSFAFIFLVGWRVDIGMGGSAEIWRQLENCFLKCGAGAIPTPLPGLLEVQTLHPHPIPTESESTIEKHP